MKREVKRRGAAVHPGLTVTLKAICRDLSIEPRQARIKLRALAKAKTLPHEPNGRWKWPVDQVDAIRAALVSAVSAT